MNLPGGPGLPSLPSRPENLSETISIVTYVSHAVISLGFRHAFSSKTRRAPVDRPRRRLSHVQ